MKKQLFAGAALVCVLGIAACSPTVTKAPGTYKTTEKAVTSSGTAVKKDTTTHVYYDKHGDKRAVEETTTTRDPKGLFNKTESKTTRTYD